MGILPLTHLVTVLIVYPLTSNLRWKLNKVIPFLFKILFHSWNGSLSHQIYQKKTHTNRDLNTHSHHRIAHKSVVLETFISKAIQTYTQYFKLEWIHLTQDIQANDYSLSQINNNNVVLRGLNKRIITCQQKRTISKWQ